MTCWRENRQKQRSSCESEGGWTSFLSSGNHVDPVDESLSQRTRRDTPRGKPPTCPSRGVNAELWPHNLRSVNTHTGKVQTRGVFFKGGWWRGDGVVVWGERPSHTQVTGKGLQYAVLANPGAPRCHTAGRGGVLENHMAWKQPSARREGKFLMVQVWLILWNWEVAQFKLWIRNFYSMWHLNNVLSLNFQILIHEHREFSL